jgi:hypothetical protein
MWFDNKALVRGFVTSLMLTATVLLGGCNTSSSDQLPPNSEVRVNPETLEWTIANNNGVCNYNAGFYEDHTISIMVVNESGNYIPDAPLKVSLDLTSNTFTGIPVMALYHDENSNGIAEDHELVSDTTSDIYEARTDPHTGTKYLIVRVNLSCAYKGTLYAFSDGFMGTLSISVEEQTTN